MWDVALRGNLNGNLGSPPARSSAMAKYLVLLGTPRDLNIPYFAMGAPRVARKLRLLGSV